MKPIYKDYLKIYYRTYKDEIPMLVLFYFFTIIISILMALEVHYFTLIMILIVPSYLFLDFKRNIKCIIDEAYHEKNLQLKYPFYYNKFVKKEN